MARRNPRIVVRQGIAITGPKLWEAFVEIARRTHGGVVPGQTVQYGTVMNDNGQSQNYELKRGWFGEWVFSPVVY